MEFHSMLRVMTTAPAKAGWVIPESKASGFCELLYHVVTVQFALMTDDP